jgi:hypothetical protein
MKNSAKTSLAALATVALTAIGGGIAVAESTSMMACTMRADQPNKYNNAVVGRENCAEPRLVDGYIYEDRGIFPDDIVGHKEFRGGVSTVNGSCGNGQGEYYSRAVSSSGASAKSAAVDRCL